MATLALSAAGSAIGSAILPSGIGAFGFAISGATIGSQLGALAGSYVDQALFGPSGQTRTYEGPRLSDLRVTASSEGAPLSRIYGRARVGGQVIWATEFEEEVSTEEAGGSGKGIGGGSGGGTTTVSYRYFANFAVALAEGEITGLGRIWADGREWDLSNVSYRLYSGTEQQAPDSLIEARLGAGNAPAFRGVAYIVFEHLALEAFGNRLPQLSFEVFRAIDDLRDAIKGAVIIPGSGEFVYATTPVTRDGEAGEQVPENVHTREAATNWEASLNQLDRTLPNVGSTSLIVSWFGTDLRAGQCEVRPGVERVSKATRPLTWGVAGQARSTAHVVSLHDGRPAYGGTPSDETVLQAIADLKTRGKKVVLTPFVLMDIAEANTLPDPYTGAAGQPAYPWRGRITLDPAPAQIGSPDKTAVATAQIDAFVGAAAVSDFSVSGQSVSYSGPAEWSYRRFILHYAHLALAAGGVDSFVIGTEMRGLTWARDDAGYPFVAALVQLANDVKALLGPTTNVTYAADWSEYFGHQPDDGSGDVAFHLDPLWASPAIDAVGIDLYWPLADWRDGTDHADAAAARSIYDLGYLRGNIAGGEGYDWFYASEADRAAQMRTPITDGNGKPWVFRYKDLANWWSNAHYDRPAGVEASQPTAWVPESKPIWLMETGCPALDKGANQPNVFYDPKSSESALPYYASRRRDDAMQRAYVQAIVEGFDPAHAGYVAGSNPVSSVYANRMIDLSRVHVYAWDARAHPAFPNDSETWGDAPNWIYGHWLNGRFASQPLADVVRQVFEDYGFGSADASTLDGVLPGFVIDRIMSLREAVQPIELAYFLDTVETAGQIAVRHRGAGSPVARLMTDELSVAADDAPLLTMTRGQETDLPVSAKIAYVTATGDYRKTIAEARRLAGFSERVATADVALMLDADQAQSVAETWLHEAWAARDRSAFVLPPSQIAVEPGDVIETVADGVVRRHRIVEVAEHGARAIEARSVDPAVYAPTAAPLRGSLVEAPPRVGTPDGVFLDLPMLRDDHAATDGYAAFYQAPWPGALALYRSPDDSGYVLAAPVPTAATIGRLEDALSNGPEGRLDYATRIRVVLDGGTLTSVSRLSLLDGANALAVERDDGEWEICQFETAELVAPRTYELSGLLRGQLGTETQAALSSVVASAGARVVLLDQNVVRVQLGEADVGRPLNWRYGPGNRDIGHASYSETAHEYEGVGRRPLSPVHVRGTRNLAGDLTIRWMRRTRIGGDSWEVADVALGEEAERYEVDILDGATVVRTLSSLGPEVMYLAADQLADFAAMPAEVNCRVYQMNATWGRGRPRDAVV